MSRQQKSRLAKVTDADRALFREAVSNTTPTLNIDSKPHSDSSEINLPSQKQRSQATKPQSTNGILSDDENSFYRPGVQKATLRNLRRGRLKIESEIDLHGCTKREAVLYLKSFLSNCFNKHFQCVRIVTGKGRSSPGHHSPIREATLSFLQTDQRVLAYTSAAPNDGGTGAFYILLAC